MQDLARFRALDGILQARESISVAEFSEICGEFSENFEVAKSLGIALDSRDSRVFSTLKCKISEATFCVVDIETTGSNAKDSDIIEIAAIKFQNGAILARFCSFVFAPIVPENIAELTGISAKMIKDAPSEREVLMRFKLFLQDCVFLAHNVGFDYNFINEKLQKYDIPPMQNARICTLALARKSFVAEKYGLAFLNEFLNINNPTHHRALADCEVAMQVFLHCLQNLTFGDSTQKLLDFTPRQKAKKKLKTKSPIQTRDGKKVRILRQIKQNGATMRLYKVVR